MKKNIIVLSIILLHVSAVAQNYQANWASINQRKIPGWFHQDKFGIFIHWGVYAVPSYAPVIPNSGLSYAEWYWYRLPTKQKEFIDFHEKNYGASFTYPQFEQQFKAELFNPEQWATVFKNSGAKYVVLTSKHHEGYCLWNSAEADRTWQRPWNAVTGTPKRDLLGDLTNAVRAEGLKMGYYYSLYEWFNPLWQQDKKKFVAEHMFPQFKDLVTKYKPAVIFSDGEWELSDTAWRSPELLAWLYNESPVAKDVVVNDRWGSNTREANSASCYVTSEYGSGMNANIVWEENQGIGHSYGYNRNEQLKDYKTSPNLILMLCDIVCRGGNLLLDIGPTADGRIPVIMQQRLTDIGNWLKINGEAIYGTEAFKEPYQWSVGIRKTKKDASFMADYSVAKMVTPNKDTAHIECFFTQKNKDLYCIMPSYSTSLTLKNIQLPAAAKVSVLGAKHNCTLKQQGKNIIIDLSAMQAGDISSSGITVIKLANALH
jgi:alpha-L-fucosidase